MLILRVHCAVCILADQEIYELSTDGQVRLVCSVRLVCLIRLKTDNFHLFLRLKTDKRQTSVCTMSKR